MSVDGVGALSERGQSGSASGSNQGPRGFLRGVCCLLSLFAYGPHIPIQVYRVVKTYSPGSNYQSSARQGHPAWLISKGGVCCKRRSRSASCVGCTLAQSAIWRRETLYASADQSPGVFYWPVSFKYRRGKAPYWLIFTPPEATNTGPV